MEITTDYLIVGSGPGGSAAAYVLRNKTDKIIVLEAGANRNSEVSDLNHLFESYNDRKLLFPGSCYSTLLKRSFDFTTGRMVGGAGNLAIQYVRGTKGQYDYWESSLQSDIWGWKNISSLYDHLESKIELHDQKADKLSIKNVQEIDDYNRSEVGCFSDWKLYMRSDGTRSIPSSILLKGVELYTNCTVLQLLFADSGTKCTGVIAFYKGKTITFNAKYVILATGIYTSGLLLKAGIGPNGRRIKSPYVGLRLKNQLMVKITGKGLPQLSNNAIFSGGCFLPNQNSHVRSYQIMRMGNSLIGIILFPFSMGSITVFDEDPFSQLIVDPGFLTNEKDVHDLMFLTRKIAMEFTELDNISHDILNKDENLREWIYKNVEPTHHWVGSNRMGKTINEGVVDINGKVFGSENLYISDGSIAITENAGSTSSMCYIIGLNIGISLAQKT